MIGGGLHFRVCCQLPGRLPGLFDGRVWLAGLFEDCHTIADLREVGSVVAEALSLGRALEALFKPAAKERQKEDGGTAPGKPKNTGGNLPQVNGKTCDQVGAAVGMVVQPLPLEK